MQKPIINQIKSLKIIRNILINAAVVTSFYIISVNLPITQIVNNIFSDFLQGSVRSRPDIVVVGIDDKSLQKIGSWPWNREIFAKAIDKLKQAKARVIGLDVLFLEQREGDLALVNTIASGDIKVILATKYVDNTLFTSRLESNNIRQGYINISTDSDGKLRRMSPFQNINGECAESFSLSIVKEYLRVIDKPICNSRNIALRENVLEIPNSGLLQFQYSDRKYEIVSFVDLIEGKIDLKTFKDKIVLLGSTTIDLRSNLNDNFIDVKGNTIPGILIHANIINTFLENKFLKTPNPMYTYSFTLVITSIFLYFYLKSKNDLVYSISYLLIIFAIAIVGLLLFDFNYNIPVITLIFTLTLCYFYSITYRNISERIEKRFVKQVFSQYVNPVLLEKIVDRPELLKLGGINKEMTIMFSDIRGFTSMSESMTPEELVSVLNSYLDKMGNVIDRYNGTIDKFIGDAIMAFWNAPLDDINHRLNSIKTALDMVDALCDFNSEYGTNFNIGIGINTGKVIVGNLGSSRRFDYTVIGDDVNLASRTEGLTKKYGVNLLVIESTIHNLEDSEDFAIRLIDEVIVKGKTAPVKLYQPLRRNDSNISLASQYNFAFDKYQKGDFNAARDVFKKLGNDGPATLMLDRINTIPNLKDKKGIWKWDEK